MFNWLEKNPFFFAVAVFIVIAYAGVVEILPDFADRARPIEGRKPYTVLQLAGRQIYINNSCNACHSQLIRPFKSETDRYGDYSKSGEYAYDRPFLWGSKRTGPDLMRVGNYRTTDWHENHMKDPKSVVPTSIMPAYKHMFIKNADIQTAYAEAFTVKKVFNVPYDKENMPKLGDESQKEFFKSTHKEFISYDETTKMFSVKNEISSAYAEFLNEAVAIVNQMKDEDVKEAFKNGEIKEIIAIIAYMNSLK